MKKRELSEGSLLRLSLQRCNRSLLSVSARVALSSPSCKGLALLDRCMFCMLQLLWTNKGSQSVLQTKATLSLVMQSLLQQLLSREAADGGATISFENFNAESQPTAKVTLTVTMEFGSNIESRLHGLWTDTAFELQLFLQKSSLHPLGFTFSK